MAVECKPAMEQQEESLRSSLLDLSFFLLRLEAFRIGGSTFMRKSNVLVNPTSQIDHLAAFTAKWRCLSFIQEKHSSAGTACQLAWIVTQPISSTFHAGTLEKLRHGDIRKPPTQMMTGRVLYCRSLWHVLGNRNTTLADVNSHRERCFPMFKITCWLIHAQVYQGVWWKKP